jgi:hypothetical protein
MAPLPAEKVRQEDEYGYQDEAGYGGGPEFRDGEVR